MDRHKTIELIESRIKSEYRKHKELDWAKIAAHKIYGALSERFDWIDYNFHKIETRPPEYGKYLIKRKDGKIHWETWNGSGWAYNHEVIVAWLRIPE